jgi:orotidine-5'-phosphate decarboxylase
METFGARLYAAMAERGQLCVGIDPHAELLAHWGLPDSVDGVAEFSRTVVSALADRVAVFKPQSAFYERFGSSGIAILESIIRQLRGAGALVLLDVKRGDIGSTMAAYAAAYLDPKSPIAVDAITVSPFLGFGSLRPVMDLVTEHGAGAFVLARTSNPEGGDVQTALSPDGRTVAQHIVDEISQLNVGAEPIGSVGAVIGATVGATGLSLAKINGPMLAPGLGAQGGQAADLRTVFGDNLSLVLPSYSREVLGAGPDVDGLRAAASTALAACQAVLTPKG